MIAHLYPWHYHLCEGCGAKLYVCAEGTTESRSHVCPGVWVITAPAPKDGAKIKKPSKPRDSKYGPQWGNQV